MAKVNRRKGPRPPATPPQPAAQTALCMVRLSSNGPVRTPVLCPEHATWPYHIVGGLCGVTASDSHPHNCLSLREEIVISRHRSRRLVLLAALLLAGLTVSLFPGSVALAQGPIDKWSVVGKMGFSTARAGNPSLALSSKDIPYLAYVDYQWGNLDTSGHRPTLLRYGLGDRGDARALERPSLGSCGAGRRSARGVDSHNEPYVVYKGQINGDSFANRGQIHRRGSTLEPRWPGGLRLWQDVSVLVIDRETDTPYVAFIDLPPRH